MKILIIGRGAREHCLAWKCSQSKLVSDIFVAKGNHAINKVATIVDIEETDIQGLLQFALMEKIDLTVVGTETPLELGIADLFVAKGLNIFAPSKNAAKIESSKDFAKKMMKECGIQSADYRTFTDFEEAKNHITNQGVPIVIKNDGLAAGKGVIVAKNLEDAYHAIDIFLNKNIFGEKKVVIEEYLEGEEFTLMCLVHKDRFVALPFSQDHKRAYDNDLGPNTGGMGAYCDMPQMDCYDESIEKVIKPIIHKLSLEGIPFTGFLYAGLMMTKNGIRVIEFNARFGDPECEVILPVLNIDLVETILTLMDESKEFTSHRITAISKCMGVVIASKGYPEKPVIGNEILFPKDDNILVFHAGTCFKERSFVSTGGRVVVIVSIGEDLKIVRNKVYNYIDSMKLSDQFFYRKDIGSRALQFLNNQ